MCSSDLALAGRGAELIVFDDPLDLKDASNEVRTELVNQRFDSLVVSRLNNPATGRIVIIAHRLNDNDLSAHVLQQGGWHHVALPLVATKRQTYDLGYALWRRPRGDVLRPDAFSNKLVERLKTTAINPDFELY